MQSNPVLRWRLERAMPVKFKAADFNARSADVGIEEIHLVHEGLFMEGA
ncbi:MAG: phage tail protein [Hydrogenophaga sp.]